MLGWDLEDDYCLCVPESIPLTHTPVSNLSKLTGSS